MHRALAIAAVLALSPARGQVVNPVYVDDSPAAAEVLAQLDALVARGSEGEAVRSLQHLLEAEPDRLVPDPEDGSVFRPVRAMVHAALLSRPGLLSRYRASVGPAAARALAGGDAAGVERSSLLTEAGFDAAVAVAEGRLSAGSFDAARLTLAQLAGHPDRAGERGARAGRLLATVARYTGSAADRELGLSWVREAGGEADESAYGFVSAPASARRVGYGSFAAMEALGSESLLERPLRSARLDDAEAGGESPPVDQHEPWVLPTVAGDLLLVNDGDRIAAFDAATLERLWVSEPAADAQLDPGEARRPRHASQMEDSVSVTAGGSVGVAATGRLYGRRRFGDPRVHGLDLSDGRVIWSVRAAGVDPALGGATVFGPVVVSGDTAVIGFFTFAQLRRVHLAHLAGVDLYTGATRWVRLVATAGVLPSQRDVDVAPAMLAEGGVVYRVEPLGVVSAVEAATGRPVWTRRVTPSAEQPGPSREAWEQPVPIVAGGRLLVVSPDLTSLLGLDPATGAVLGRVGLGSFGWPDYFLEAGDRLVSVGHGGVRSVPVGSVFEAESVEVAAGPVGSTGRAVVAGDRVIVPTQRGALVVDPSGGAGAALALQHPGSLVVAGGQLVALSGASVHGYMDWSNARRVLSERLAADPSDARPAIALAELAYRSGRHGEISTAAQAAIEAMGRGANPEPMRRRLVAALRSMLDDEAPGLGPGDRGSIIETLSLVASSPGERAGVIMHRAAWLADRGDERGAVREYQSVLQDPALSSAEHGTRWRVERAGRAATSALAALVTREGPGIYREFDQQARRSLDALRADAAGASASALESLAQSYPLARSAPEAWLAASEAHESSGSGRSARAALEAGFEACVRVGAKRAGDEAASELAGRLSRRYEAEGRAYTAAQTVRRAASELGLSVLTDRGERFEASALETALRARLASEQRPARIAASPREMVLMLGGWSLVRPASTAGPAATTHVLMRSAARGVVALFAAGAAPGAGLGFDPEAGVVAHPGERAPVAPIWSRALGEDPEAEPRLLRLSPSEALFLTGRHAQARLELVDALTGATRWVSPAFGETFPDDPPRYATGVIDTPLDGRQWLRDQVVLVSSTHAGLIDRFGRAAVYELATGRAVLTRRLDVPVVYDAALERGVLAVVGERPGDRARRETAGAVPMAAAYDLETGGAIFGPAEFRDQASFGRWVRLDGDDTMLVGIDSGVVGIDLAVGAVSWTVDDPAVGLSGECWVGRDHAFVLGVDRQVWQIDLDGGALRGRPLEDLSRVTGASEVDLVLLETGESVFATDLGMVAYDAEGRLIGGDGLNLEARFVRPASADGLLVSVSRSPTPDGIDAPRGPGRYRYVAMELPGGTLRAEAGLDLPGQPGSVAVLDDLVLVTSEDSTAVYAAPAVE
jgi:outer membrane protein assembly factor BamB